MRRKQIKNKISYYIEVNFMDFSSVAAKDSWQKCHEKKLAKLHKPTSKILHMKTKTKITTHISRMTRISKNNRNMSKSVCQCYAST